MTKICLYNSTPLPQKEPGFTLVELLIAIFILQLVIAPLFLMFSSTRQTMFKAADTLVAASLASSLIAGLHELPAKDLRFQPLLDDRQLSSALNLKNLGVPPAPPEFTRMLEIRPFKMSDNDKTRLFLVEVRVSWHNRKSTTPVSYIVRSFVKGKT